MGYSISFGVSGMHVFELGQFEHPLEQHEFLPSCLFFISLNTIKPKTKAIIPITIISPMISPAFLLLLLLLFRFCWV